MHVEWVQLQVIQLLHRLETGVDHPIEREQKKDDENGQRKVKPDKFSPEGLVHFSLPSSGI
jgi:hypothetical protein